MSKHPSRTRKYAALRGGIESEGASPGNGRTAGPDAMADPDPSWDVVAQASDASFPCSDAPSWSAVRIGESMNGGEARSHATPRASVVTR